MKHRVMFGLVIAASSLASNAAAWPREIVVEAPTALKKAPSARRTAATPAVVPVAPLTSRLAAPARPVDLPLPGLAQLGARPLSPPSASSTAAATATAAPSATTAPTATQPSGPEKATPVEITGSYGISGQGDDGIKYTGVATITKIGGEMYGATWVIGSNTFEGVCFRDTTTLSCGWSAKPKDANVISYLIESNALDGVWFESGGTKLGTEQLKPVAGKVKKDLAGDYAIAPGRNPDGSSYSGSVRITPLPAVCAGCYALNWTISSLSQSGVAVRATGAQPILAASFPDSGTSFGALQYQINGKDLTGTWIQSIRATVSAGTEVLKKR